MPRRTRQPSQPFRQLARRCASVWAIAVSTLLPSAVLAAQPQPAARLPAGWTPVQSAHSAAFELHSRHTGQRYRIMVALPHQPPPPAGYPVLWALDGNATFPLLEFARPRPSAPGENPRWRRKVGTEPAGLIVAVGYPSGEPMDVDARALDYTPSTAAPTGDQLSARHGGAPQFLRFLTEELRPLLAAHFSMDPQRHTLFGFSYGGLFALHTLVTAPQHFQRYWAASPSLWFGQGEVLRTLAARLPPLRESTGPLRLMLTVGLEEQHPTQPPPPERLRMLQQRAMVDNAREFVRQVREEAGAAVQVQYQALPAHDHHDMLFHGARRVVEFAFAP